MCWPGWAVCQTTWSWSCSSLIKIKLHNWFDYCCLISTRQVYYCNDQMTDIFLYKFSGGWGGKNVCLLSQHVMTPCKCGLQTWHTFCQILQSHITMRDWNHELQSDWHRCDDFYHQLCIFCWIPLSVSLSCSCKLLCHLDCNAVKVDICLLTAFESMSSKSLWVAACSGWGSRKTAQLSSSVSSLTSILRV